MDLDFYREAQEMFEYTRDLRRDFHVHPEIGFQEYRTAGIVAEELGKLDIEVMTGIAETGVVGIIEGEKDGPVVLLRFDMDALPVTEETGAVYASQTDGVMHACGHDGHTAIGLTVAKLLHSHRDRLAGSVKLVFQPAEEGLGGAERMVAEGVLENPRPDYSLSLHLWNEIPVGKIGVTPGPMMAGADKFTIKITGKGAHAAQPHGSIDPIVAAAQVISAVQTIVSRNVDPLEAAVISIASIHGGTAFNIIPPDVDLKGTMRAYLPEVRKLLMVRLKSIVNGVAQAMGCEAEIQFYDVTPAVINDAAMAALVQGVVREVLPEADILDNMRTMGSEDMALMMTDIPGCYFFIGSNNDEKELNYGHHHPKFDFDESALPRAVALIAAAAAEILQV